MRQLIAQALREAIAPHVTQEATPAVCHAIKRSFVTIMRDRYSINWMRHAKRIKVEFLEDGQPNILIPEELLERTLH